MSGRGYTTAEVVWGRGRGGLPQASFELTYSKGK